MMRAQLERYAPYLAYVGLAALGAALVSFVLAGELDLRTELIGGAGIVLVAMLAMLRPQLVAAALTGRTARYGSNALVMSLAFLGILGLLNFIGNRQHQRFDLTETREFSLSPQTIQILKSLKEPLRVTAFYTAGAYDRQQAEDRLKEYSQHTDKLTYEFIDPDMQPGLARQFEITRDGTLVFQMGGKRQEIYSTLESDLTGAILKLRRDKPKAVYFLTGHRERDPETYSDEGYSDMRQRLEKDNYRVATLNLVITDTVPSDAAVIVVAGPQAAFSDKERATLATYLDGGGRVLVMLDPGLPDPMGDLLSKWGVTLRNDFVLDPTNNFLGDARSPVVSRYPFHTITKDLPGLTTFFPLARSINVSSVAGVSYTTLVSSSHDSWGETDLQSRQAKFDADKDSRGPVDLAVAVEQTSGAADTGSTQKPKARLVVIGDSDFAANSVLLRVQGAIGNADLFLNAVNWLAEEETLISLRAQPTPPRFLMLTGEQVNLIFLVTVIVLPALVLIAGGVVWWQRR